MNVSKNLFLRTMFLFLICVRLFVYRNIHYFSNASNCLHFRVIYVRYIQEVINYFHGIFIFYYGLGEGRIITIIIFIFKSYNKGDHYILPVPGVNKTTDRTSVLVYATVFILGSLTVDFVHI